MNTSTSCGDVRADVKVRQEHGKRLNGVNRHRLAHGARQREAADIVDLSCNTRHVHLISAVTHEVCIQFELQHTTCTCNLSCSTRTLFYLSYNTRDVHLFEL